MASNGEQAVHVLAVDDSALERRLMERMLQSLSYKVTTVDSARKALEFLGANETDTDGPSQMEMVDIIITDYCMPEMTGEDLLKHVKGCPSLKKIPVVVVSSEEELDRINRCMEEGAEGFLIKPLKISDVSRLVNHVFASGRSN